MARSAISESRVCEMTTCATRGNAVWQREIASSASPPPGDSSSTTASGGVVMTAASAARQEAYSPATTMSAWLATAAAMPERARA